MYLKNKKLLYSMRLCFLSLFYNGTITGGHAMDVFSVIYKVGNVACGAVQGAASYLEIPKETQEEFKERITRLDTKGAEGIFQKEIQNLELSTSLQKSSLGEDDFIFLQNKEAVITLYNRMVIAAVTVDYVRTCLDSINNVIATLNQKINQPQYHNFKGELEELKKFTEEKIKVNLGAMLYSRYQYTRGGGIIDRGTTSLSAKKPRLKLWGVKSFDAPDYTSYSHVIEDLKGKENRVEIQNFLLMHRQYQNTLELLSKTESTLLNPKEEKGIYYYADEGVLYKIFGRLLKLTPVNLYSETFEINLKKMTITEEEEEINNKEELIDNSTSAPLFIDPLIKKTSPIEIPRKKKNNYFSPINKNDGDTLIIPLVKKNEVMVKKTTSKPVYLPQERPLKKNQLTSQLTSELLKRTESDNEADNNEDLLTEQEEK